jgi:predicted ATPase
VYGCKRREWETDTESGWAFSRAAGAGAATSLARLWRDMGRANKARELLSPVYDRFTEGFETTDLKAAKSLVDDLKHMNASEH